VICSIRVICSWCGVPLARLLQRTTKNKKASISAFLPIWLRSPADSTSQDRITQPFFSMACCPVVLCFFNGLAMNVTMAFKVLWLIPEHCKLWPHVNPWQTPPSADDAIPESNHFCGQATRSCEEQPHHLHSTRSCTCA